MVILKAIKYRIYPTKVQAELLEKQFGCARFVYNRFLAVRKEYYLAHKDDPEKKGLNYYDTAEQLKEMKKQPEYTWLKEAHSQVLQQSILNLDRAFQNFFAKRAKYPKFKRKHAVQSIRFPQYFFVLDRQISIPKIGKVKAKIHRPLEGKPKSLTLTKTKAGRYFAAIQVEVEVPEPQPKAGAVGIDLGLKSFLVTSDGQEIAPPKHLLKAQKRLAGLQCRWSRCKKGSHGREKARLALARQHEKVANQRSDFLHKISHPLTQTYGWIGLEDLNVRGMVKNHRLARAIFDAGWGELKRQLTYKAAWNGGSVIEVDRFFPSSKRCSACQHSLPDLPLSVREWDCPTCGVHHDRDHNAAINILQEALRRVGSPRIYAEGVNVSPISGLAAHAELGSHPLKRVVLHILRFSLDFHDAPCYTIYDAVRHKRDKN
jgi:putative transposase